MNGFSPPSHDAQWKEIAIILKAYAVDLINSYSWYRGRKALPKGTTAEDLVQQTIMTYLDNPGGYNPAKGEFLSYLKYFLLRRLVYNLNRLDENQKGIDVFRLSRDEDLEVNSYDDYLPAEILDLDEKLDLDKITEAIFERMNGDVAVEKIFEGIFMQGLKRREVCKEYELSSAEFNNGLRRLYTIIHSAKLVLRIT